MSSYFWLILISAKSVYDHFLFSVRDITVTVSFILCGFNTRQIVQLVILKMTLYGCCKNADFCCHLLQVSNKLFPKLLSNFLSRDPFQFLAQKSTLLSLLPAAATTTPATTATTTPTRATAATCQHWFPKSFSSPLTTIDPPLPGLSADDQFFCNDFFVHKINAT